jgi:hypothetical protein
MNVVIPTKCNFTDLTNLVECLLRDSTVKKVVVVADGDQAYETLTIIMPPSVVLLKVPLSIGLHRMWNLGMDECGPEDHLAIINDDVCLDENSMSIVESLLNLHSNIGLISPSNDPQCTDEFLGMTGFAGFCMVLNKVLVSEWRFDERMKWWYGDNDVITWVAKTKGMQTGMTGLCHAIGNRSHTISTSPPPNFINDINNDARIFREKWSIKD